MKKKRFMGLLALASCVTLLTGCESDALWGLGGVWNNVVEYSKKGLDYVKGLMGFETEEKEEKGSDSGNKPAPTPTPDPTPTPSVSIEVNGLPEKVDVRESIDLDEFVTVSGASSYEVVLSSSSANVASLEGHVLTTVSEGTVNFTLKAGSVSKECSVISSSVIREFLIEQFTASSNRYNVYDLSYDSESGQYLISDYYIHNDNYILTRYFDEDEGGNILPGGWCSFEGDDCYSYMISTDDQEVEHVVDLTLSQSVYLEVYNPEIEADYYFEENYSYEYDEDYEEGMIVLSGQTAKYWAQEALMTYQGQFKGYKLDEEGNRIIVTDPETGEQSYATTTYVYDRFEFTLDEYEEEGVVYKDLYLSSYIYDIEDESQELIPSGFYGIVIGEDAGYELLDEFVVPENKPESIDYFREYFGISMDNFMVSDECLLGSDGAYVSSFAWLAPDGSPADTTQASFEGALFGWAPYFETSAPMVVGNGTSVWQVDTSSGSPNVLEGNLLVSGESGSSVWYALKDESEAGFYVEKVDGSSPWNSAIGLAGLRDGNNYDPDCFVSVEEAVYDTYEEEGQDPVDILSYTFAFSSSKQAPIVNVIINGLGLAEVKDLETMLNSYNGDGVFESELCELSLVVIPQYGIVQFVLDIYYNVASYPFIYEVTVTSQVTSYYASYVSSLEAAVSPLCVEE